jgi:hypothetical protein
MDNIHGLIKSFYIKEIFKMISNMVMESYIKINKNNIKGNG